MPEFHARWAALKKKGVILKKNCGRVGRLHLFEAGEDEEGHSRGRLFRREGGVDALIAPSRERWAVIAVFWHFYGGLSRVSISETAAKARKASKIPGEDPQPVQDPPKRMSNPTDRTEATSAPIDRTSDEGELPQTGDGARADDVGSVTTTSQPPSTSQCESTPRLGPDPVGASTVRGDPREDAPEPEAAYESDEMEDAIRARRRVQTTRGRRKTPPVIWTSSSA
ncbi:hypothetical protein PC123_g21672 [Phytophthora cactorum]|nr:hypothetical protein PC123_g21672 [Phytophthora cactorum]